MKISNLIPIKLLCFIFLCFVSSLTFSETKHSFNNTQDHVTNLPGYGPVKETQFAGYLPTSDKNLGHLFYWYVETRDHSKHAPLILWLNGGPGASSLYGLFIEHGPYITNKNGTLSDRQFSWNQHADYLIIDQPAGTGLSYETRKSYDNETQAMDQLFYALKSFYLIHPELTEKPLYLAGQSYAGKYLPQLATRILNSKEKNKIILAGLLIGDGWVNPRIQQSRDADYAYSHGLIDQTQYVQARKLYAQCAKEIEAHTPSTAKAHEACDHILKFIKQESGLTNLANISSNPLPEEHYMAQYLNDPKVRQALYINSKSGSFNTSSDKVAKRLQIGEQDSVADLYGSLLHAGIPIIIYNGLEDGLDCNVMGTDAWLAKLNWREKTAFENASTCIWKVNGDVAGYVKHAAGLTQIKIRNAGHNAPYDQPEYLLDLLNRVINQRPFC